MAEGSDNDTSKNSHRHQERIKFLNLNDRQNTEEMDLQLNEDNNKTHKHPR